MIGRRFGKLVVVATAEPVINKNGTRSTRWLTKCDCGEEKRVRQGSLVTNHTQSCGCVQKDKAAAHIGRVRFSRDPDASAKNDVWLSYRSEARKRGYCWELSMEQFTDLTSSNCAYCGKPPSNGFRREYKMREGVFIYNGIDRQDSSLGYSLANCVSCCRLCNRMKQRLSVPDFIHHVRLIVAYSEATHG